MSANPESEVPDLEGNDAESNSSKSLVPPSADCEMHSPSLNDNINDSKSIDVEELATSTQNMSVEQEHFLKPKKHRRGKKRRQRSRSENSDGGNNPSYDPSDPEFGQYLLIDSDNPGEQQRENNQVRNNMPYVLIRPLDVPKAPMNSTQFIIDDHEDCGLYVSFEKPPKATDSRNVDEIQHSPSHYKAAYEDIDYVYECEDWEDSSFCQKDFENVYYKARFDDLIELEKEELLVMYKNLEAQACKLEEELAQCDPMYKLNALQEQLLKLQEENVALKLTHRELKQRTRRNSHSATSSLEDHHDTSSSEEEVTHEALSPKYA